MKDKKNLMIIKMSSWDRKIGHKKEKTIRMTMDMAGIKRGIRMWAWIGMQIRKMKAKSKRTLCGMKWDRLKVLSDILLITITKRNHTITLVLKRMQKTNLNKVLLLISMLMEEVSILEPLFTRKHSMWASLLKILIIY